MLKTIAPAEMKRVETSVMEHTSITGEELMQTAASHVAQAVMRICEGKTGRVVCVCGTGNNGGDGLAAMRMLAEKQPDFLGECWMLPGRLSADAQREMDRLVQKTPQVKLRWLEKEHWPETEPVCAIDAMFGTGLARPLEGLALAMCRLLNEWDAPVVAVDIPSGLNGLTGEVMGEAVMAAQTVTFHRPKSGLFLKNGADYAGMITVADIGLNVPEAAVYDDAEGFAVMEKADLFRLLPRRKRNTHKGSYGKVLLFAGSRGMAGAAAISAVAALRAGAGLVCVACPDSIVDTVQALCPCATCLPLCENADEAWLLLREKLLWADAVAAGCGLGTGEWAESLLDKMLKWLSENEKPAVLDADALNLSAKAGRTISSCFVTPHPAEAARLLGMDTAQIMAQPQQAVQQLARRYGNAVLKGACSLLCDGKGMAVNPYGTPAMAKGGSGDALTGIMAAMLAGRAAGAYVMSDLEVMQVSCALHGLAGEIAAERFGERGMLATDLCECIGLVEGEKTEKHVQKSVRSAALGRRVTVVVEHMMGTRDEDGGQRVYPFNCGFVREVLDECNQWQDACILGVSHPLEWMEGIVAATVQADGREVWIVTEKGTVLSDQEIAQQLRFFADAGRIDRL